MYGKPSRSVSRLRIEQLEARAMLAITAVQDIDGLVYVTGNDEAEFVQILQSNTNEWTVAEYSDFDFGNQLSSTVFTDVSGFDVKLRGGDDRLGLIGDFDPETTELSGSISIASGQGADLIEVLGVRLVGDLTIHNAGSDTGGEEGIGVSDMVVGGSLGINGGTGREFVKLEFNDIRQSLYLAMGAGNDQVELRNVRVEDDVFIRLGQGDDFLTWTKNDDTLGVDVGGSATIQGGGGNDDIGFFGIDDDAGALQFGGGLNLLLGDGNDGTDTLRPTIFSFVKVYGASTIRGGAGDDTIDISQSYFEDLTLRMGTGNDNVTIFDTEGSLTAYGGTGTDELFVIDSPELVAMVRQFETYEVT